MLHRRGFGGSGRKHVDEVYDFIKEIKAKSLLDYGCGEGTLADALLMAGWAGSIRQYDPAIPEHSQLPSPADLVVATDVLEHVEPELLGNVINHIFSLATRAVFLIIATRPANKFLTDGRNAHLILESMKWWRTRLQRPGWKILRQVDRRKAGGAPHEIKFWIIRS